MDTRIGPVTLVGKIELESPLILGPGIVKMSGPEWDEALKSAAAAITIGSITKQARTGNPGTTYWNRDEASLNSLGLPNPGADWYGRNLGSMVEEAHRAGKQVITSIAGFSPDEYGELAKVAANAGTDIIEVNLGCPNVWGGSGQKPIASFVPNMFAEILFKIAHQLGSEAGLAIKLSPYSDPSQLEEMARVINAYNNVQIVVTTNTFPNALGYESGKSVITTHEGNPSGYAGLGGKAMKHIALGQIAQFRKLLRPDIQIIGIGGVSTWADVKDLLAAGAAAVGITTAAIETRCRVFSNILMEAVA